MKKKVLINIFIILVILVNWTSCSREDVERKKQEFQERNAQRQEIRDQKLKNIEQTREDAKIAREKKFSEMKIQREQNIQQMQEEINMKMNEIQQKDNNLVNGQYTQEEYEQHILNKQILENDGQDEKHQSKKEQRRGLQVDEDSRSEWRQRRDKEMERERERERRRKERMKAMGDEYEDDVITKEEFDIERKERRERREERRREREERKAKFSSRNSGMNDDDIGKVPGFDEEDDHHHDIDDMMDDLDLRDRIHMKDNEFSRRHKKGKNDQEGKEVRNILLSGSEDQTYPVLQYIHSGKSQYNWNIEYNRRSRKTDINIVFGDSRFERLQHSQKYMYNYIWGHEAYTDKFQLTDNLRDLDKTKKYNLKSDEFHPQSYLINMQYKDYSEQELDFLDIAEDSNHTWIEKPNNSAGSTGIKLHKQIDRFIKSMKLRKERARKQNANESNESEIRFDKFRSVTIQEYVDNPLIVNQKKCDLTHHILTIYTGSNWLYYVYDTPNARCSQQDYTKTKVNNSKIHTTNLEKVENEYYYLEDDEYEQLANQFSLTEEKYWQQIKKQYKKSDSDIQKLKDKIDDVIIYAFEAGQNKINPEKGFYHLWSVDVMIDTHMNPWVFDIDYFPNIKPKTPAKKQAMQNMGQGLIDILVKLNDNWDNMDDLIKHNDYIDQNSYRLIYNTASKYNPLEKYSRKGRIEQGDL